MTNVGGLVAVATCEVIGKVIGSCSIKCLHPSSLTAARVHGEVPIHLQLHCDLLESVNCYQQQQNGQKCYIMTQFSLFLCNKEYYNSGKLNVSFLNCFLFNFQHIFAKQYQPIMLRLTIIFLCFFPTNNRTPVPQCMVPFYSAIFQHSIHPSRRHFHKHLQGTTPVFSNHTHSPHIQYGQYTTPTID